MAVDKTRIISKSFNLEIAQNSNVYNLIKQKVQPIDGDLAHMHDTLGDWKLIFLKNRKQILPLSTEINDKPLP